MPLTDPADDSLLRRLAREPAAILGVVTAGLALLIAFGVHLTDIQTGAVVGFVAALFFLLRFLVTPSSEVLAQQTPDGPVAGDAAAVETGAPVDVTVRPLPPRGRRRP